MKKVIYMGFYTDDATWFYRMSVLGAIKHHGLTIEQKPYSGNVTWSTFLGYDTLILERPSSTDDLKIIKLAKQVGLKVITDWDDDCLHVPVMNPMWHHYQLCRADVMECIALSDEVWVSTPGVKKAYSLYNNNIHVIPNAHNDYLFPVEHKKDINPETKKAFWRGGGSHEADVYSVADKLLKTINQNNKWMFHIIGTRFIYIELKCGSNYQPVSGMPLMQYFDYMAKENPSVVFHPLQNNKFNESKSNIAWLESTYAGAAFFGNKSLPEFDKTMIFDFSELGECMNGKHNEVLKSLNDDSWSYICENLLLSITNKIREERLLAI